MKTAKHKMVLKSFGALSIEELDFSPAASPEPTLSPPRLVPEGAQDLSVRRQGPARRDDWRGGDRRAQTAASTSRSASAHLLVVETADELRTRLGGALQRAGFAVAMAANGQEALREYHPGKTDLVLLGMERDDDDSWDTFERLMGLQPPPAILVLAGRSSPWSGTPATLDFQTLSASDIPTLLSAVGKVLAESAEERAIRVALQQNVARFARPYALTPWPGEVPRHWGINE